MDRKDIVFNTFLIIAHLIVGVSLITRATSWVFVTIGIGACFFSAYYTLAYYSKLADDLGGTFSLAYWHRRFPWLVDLLVIAVFVSITVWLLFPCIKGGMPFSWDHPIHLLRFGDFVQMLDKGKLSGWSDSWNQGYPLGEAYPPGVNWWCGLFYVITLGKLSLEATYLLAFLVFYALVGVAVYHLGKTFFNRPVGFLAGVVCLLDIGEWRQGGYHYIVNIGVWTQSLGTVFALFAFSYLYRVLVRGRRLDLILCAIALASSVLCHPMCLVYYAIGLPLFFMIYSIGDKRKPFIFPTLVALLLGFMLAAVWIVPFVLKSEWFIKDGGLKWLKLEEIATRIIAGTLFKKTGPFLIWFGIIGGILAFRRKHLEGIFLLCVSGVLLVFASKDVFYEINYPAISSSFKNLIYERVCILVKPFMFILASYAVYSLFKLKPTKSATWRDLIVVAVLMVLVIAPLAKPMVKSLQSFNKIKGKQIIGKVITKDDIGYWEDFQDFAKWMRKEKEKTKEFFRIAYDAKKSNHFFACAPNYTGIPAYKKGTSPAPPFQGRPKYDKPEEQKWLSIKYVVRVGELKRRKLELERTFGKINVYRNPSYNPNRYTIAGPGEVKVEKFESEYIKLEVAKTSAKSRIIIHRANFENWKATHNGKPMSITNRRLGGKVNAISVPARDGVIEIWYDWPRSNIISSIISWFALATLILIGIMPYLGKLRKYSFLDKLRKLIRIR